MKTEMLNIRVEKKLKEALQSMADKDKRKLSDFVHLILLDVVKEKKSK